MTVSEIAPPPLRASLATRCLWRASASGRARLALLKAQEEDGNAAARADVANAAAALEFDPAPQSRATLRDCLQYRAAMALRDGAFGELPQILATFDRVLPQDVLRVTIRIALLRHLPEAANPAALEEQTAALMADPLAVARAPKELVIEALCAIYERLSPTAALRVFGRAHEAWRKHPEIEAIRGVCACPSTFHSHAEATRWAKTMADLPGSLPAVVRADALCIQARCSEWDGDYEAMEDQAFAARELAPRRPAVCYWLTRALLQRPEGDAAKYLREGMPDTPAADWQRLECYCALHAELQRGEFDLGKVKPVAEACKGPIEKSEGGMAQWLLERALTSPWARQESNLERCAELSEGVPDRPTWAEINLALVDIVLRRDYAGALRRLEKELVSEDPEAPPLRRAARILAGAPLASPPGENNLLTLLENALRSLLGGLPASGGESSAARLRDALTRAQPEDEEDIVSQRLAGVARVLGGVMDAASDPEAAAEWIRGGGAPAVLSHLRVSWLSLLVARIWLGMHARLPGTPFLDAGFVSDPGTARLVVAWWDCHALAGRQPAAVEAARALLGEGRPGEPDLFAGASELDERVLSQLLAARQLLAAARPAEAASLVEALLSGPLEQSALSRNLWGPVCEYWLGVAAARAGRGTAALEQALSSVKRVDAKAQLALLALQAGDLEAAAGWAGPGEPATPAGDFARSLLLSRKGLQSSHPAELEEQTATLMADPLAGAQVPGELIIEALGSIYERISPEASVRVFGRAHEAWKKLPFVEAIRCVCTCPGVFGSLAEATMWGKAVRDLPGSLPDVVRADALCIQVRCSEWDGDYEAMAEQAFEACKLAPGRPAVCYWLTRALLRRPEGDAAKYLREGMPARPSAEWQRLECFCALHEELPSDEPDLRKVPPVLEAARGKTGPIEQTEKGLAQWLLERALTSPWARQEASLRHCAELSAKVPDTPAWVEINLALVDLVLGHDPEGALRRLEKKLVAEHPEAPPLKRAARILAGAPLPSPPGEHNLLTLLENALRSLLGGLESSDARLRDELKGAQPDDAHDLVSQRLAGVARVLGGVMDAASDPEVAAEWIRGGGAQAVRHELPVSWMTLLVTRIWLGMHARLPDMPFPDAAFVSDPGPARLVIAWWECHGLAGCPPAAVEAARALQGQDEAGLAGASELDERVTSQLLAARQQLAADQPAEAASLVEALLSGPLKQSALSRNLWGPLCEYWLGLAEARAGRGTAVLEQALQGVKRDDAKTQLALLALQAGDLEAAAGWAGQLQGATPEGHYLRALLLRQQGEQAGADEFEEQTAALMADPLAVAQVPKELIIAALGTIYEQVSPEAAIRVLGRAHEAWKKHPVIEGMRCVCECPAIFGSHAEATKWAKTVTDLPGSLPAAVRADALCINARRFEWDGDFVAMEEQALAACQLAPRRPAACYWLTRALLRQPDSEAARYLREGMPSKPTADWHRLESFCALHEELQSAEPDLRKVAPVLEAACGKTGPFEQTEKGLALRLIERALTSPWARRESNLEHCAELSAEVPDTPVWAEINLALAGIVLSHDYAGALRRLEKEQVAEHPKAPPLRRAARILAGAPLPSPPGEHNLLTLLENALRTLLGGLESSDARLRDELKGAQPDDAHDLVSQRLAGVARVLGGVMDAASDPEVAAEWIRGGGAQAVLSQWRASWLSLLVTRIWLGMHARLPDLPFLDAAFVSDPGTARLVIAWWECHGLAGGPPAAVEAARALQGQDHAAASEPDDGVTSQLLAARQLLAADRPAEAALLVEKLLEGPLKQSALSRNLWGPVCEYWLGLAEARAGRGTGALERALRGVKRDDAKAQLALLALQAGDLEAAAGWAGPGEPATPAGHYARALLWHRQGGHAEADALLCSFADTWRETSPAYALAAKRLRAAIAERTGAAAEAEELNRAVLASAPRDGVARARLTRLCVRRVYGADSTMDDATRRDLLEGAREIPGVPWHRSQAMLCQFFTTPDAQATDLDAEDPASRAAAAGLLQVRLRGLIDAGRQEEAAGLLERSRAAAKEHLPAWQRRAQLIFDAWAALRGLGSAAAPPGARQKVAELAQAFDQFAPEPNDPPLLRWRTLLQRAVEVAPVTEPWAELGETAVLPLLWAEDASLRQQTAAALAAVDSGTSLPALFARFAAAWLTRQDDLCLELYAQLAGDLSRLPAPAPGVWAAAGSIWLRRKQWKPLIVDQLPPEVRDLRHPEARLIVGVAYAQAAADLTRSDPRQAEAHLQLASETLEPLLT